MGSMKLNYNKMTNDEILKLFKEQYEKIQPNDAMEFFEKSNNTPSYYILKTRLGLTWAEALEGIGYSCTFKRKTKEDYIRIIQDLAKQLGHTPTIDEVKQYKHIGLSNLKRTFKLNYNELLNQCNLDNNSKVQVLETNEELVQMYKSFCEKIGKVATTSDLNESEEIYNSGVYFLRFGNLNNVRKLANIPIIQERAKDKYSKYKLKNILKNEYIKKGSRLTVVELEKLYENNLDFCTINTLFKYFKTTKINSIWKEIEEELIKDYVKNK